MMNKKILSIVFGLLLFSPFFASASVTFQTVPPRIYDVNIDAYIVPPSFEIQLLTTGAFNDNVDGVGCEQPYALFRVISPEQSLDEVILPAFQTQSATRSYIANIGYSYGVEVVCSELGEINNGGGNNPATTMGFLVVSQEYYNSVYDTLFPVNHKVITSYISSGNDIAVSVANNLILWVFQFLVLTLGIAIGIVFFYWAYREAKNASQGKIGNSHEERHRRALLSGKLLQKQKAFFKKAKRNKFRGKYSVTTPGHDNFFR